MDKPILRQVTGLSIRFASEEDVPNILTFIREFAAYEKMEDQVTATEDALLENIFVRKQAEVLIAEYEGEAVGFALFFHNFSTFLGKANLYLEDLYVRPSFRGKGIGAAMLSELAAIAVERNCGRFDWCCLDWNKPSIKFYESLGAIALREWILFRTEGDALLALAKRG